MKKRKRIYFLLFLTTIWFGILLYKLVDIQLISTKSYGPINVDLLENSVEQRSHQMLLSSGRGTILDRNGEVLTSKASYDIVVSPTSEGQQVGKRVSQILNLSANKLEKLIKNLDKPTYLSELLTIEIDQNQYEQLKELDKEGFYAVERSKYEDPIIAQHLLGIVRDNPSLYKDRYGQENLLNKSMPVGISGLEKAFDSFLISKEQEKLLFHVDAKGQPMFGFDLLFSGYDNDFYPLKIKTTIDSVLQMKAENLMDDYKMQKGGLVLLDIQSRDLLAMVSRPTINKENPYMQNSVENQMLTRHFPGSVFKTVVAAAAIEQNVIDTQRMFNCSVKIHGDEPDPRDLGELNFAESFAQSCNRTFAVLGTELLAEDEKLFDQYADKLGLIGHAGWTGDIFKYDAFKQFPEEQKGVIWGEESHRSDQNFIRQTSIGQKDVKVTPLAVANMMATIANNGIKKEVRVAERILYNNGATMAAFSQEEDSTNQITPKTATRLRELMQLVTEVGTGKYLNGLSIAGKSGTAETGNNQFNNYWFAGFFPYENPKYAMVVVDIEQSAPSSNIYNVYREMVKYIYEKEN
ncbi:cell division protein FtsI/penicillin-binding protein 2 [Salirhabdus euzebyi]|uniref:serine-type D-Ala-D-Ala carboxypeptidase n=1 Tax=Salirhabdus euzebyi TaxID=394506 RepID=A0A841Q7U8_9BACI|nr:penicillin-binding protein 2 [Salirhabdus euzebyi]MBB6454362.1 cell division protein FtsI/penicillin-binding protein 2 [Salirhabdus euzebyi]